MSQDNVVTEPLPLPDEFQRPDYGGGSIANVPATVATILGVPFAGLPPLPDHLWRPISGGVKRVVLLTLDAMGWNLFRSVQSELIETLKDTAVSGQLTSVFPSTTVAALSSLWTGAAPAQHGLLGLRLFFPEYAVAAQMLSFSPVFKRYRDALVEAGMEPAQFLQTPGLGEQFTAAGVPTYAFKGREIVDSALSKMHGRGITEAFGVVSMADMMDRVRTLLEEKAGERLYISAYWPSIDTLSHKYGWQGTAVAAELRVLFFQLRTELLQRLSAAARRDTVLFVVADHGQVLTPAAQQIYLRDHPQLQQMLLMRPVGEPRVAYLYAKHGRQADVIHYLNSHLSQAMVALPSEQALTAGLFGPEPYAETAVDRLADVVVIMRQGYVLLTETDRPKAHKMLARHGGMTKAEMQVPWLGFRLDA